jgi:hypothetical protein
MDRVRPTVHGAENYEGKCRATFENLEENKLTKRTIEGRQEFWKT